MRPRKYARAATVLTLVTGGTVAGLATSATAADCEARGDVESYFSVRCNGSPPTAYQALIFCTSNQISYGTWYFVGSGSWPTARCPKSKPATYWSYSINT
jgi:hypothetical protein